MSYKLKLEFFEGPLDLLLYLVKKNHLNICDIPITEVTEQYLQYLELMRLLDLDIAGEFLVMASTLLHIKSKMLLPQDAAEVPEEEDDPRADLINQLLEYQKFKEAARQLRAMEDARREVFTRDSEAGNELASGEVYFEASLFDLITAFKKALQDVPKDVFYEVIKDEYTVEQKIHDILHFLLNSRVISLMDLFSKARNKIEIVAYFLATLELIRLKEVTIRQKGLFGEIEVLRNSVNIEPYPSNPQE